MKAILIFIPLYLLSYSFLTAQVQIINLILEKDVEYVYEYLDQYYAQTEDGINSKKSTTKKVIRIVVEDFPSKEQVLIKVNFLENNKERLSSLRRNKIDYIFPDFEKEDYVRIWEFPTNLFFVEMICFFC